MSQLPKIVFFGSGPVARSTLEGLLGHFEFEAIITKPRAPHHRGNVPVLEFAATKSLPVYTPQNKAELSDLFAKTNFQSKLGLVVDYGIIINKNVIDAFSKGIVNSHFSLLPEWRGADPITFSVLSGQKQGGVSLMLINEKLDEGLLITQEAVPLSADITTPQLTEQLVSLSNTMLIKTLPNYLAGNIAPYPQDPTNTPTYSRMLTKEDANLMLDKPAQQLEREVRAFRGWPKSRIVLFKKYPVVVTKVRVASSGDDGAIVLPCANNTWLEITELIAPSGRTVNGADFLRGYKK